MKNKNAHAENAAPETNPSAGVAQKPDTSNLSAQEPAGLEPTASEPTSSTSTSQDQFISESIEENGQTDNADTLTFSDDVIEKIAGEAAAQAEGVAGLRGGFFNRVQETFGAKTHKGVAVEVEEDGSVALYISIVMRFGYYAPDVFEDVRTRVLKAISQMTGLQIASVNLRIEDIVAPSDDADKPAAAANKPAATAADDSAAAASNHATDDSAKR